MTAPPSRPPELLLATTTVATRDQALHLARLLVEEKLAACVQLQAIESVYRWDGVLQQEPEWRLLIKTLESRWPAARQRLLSEHPYELPALTAWPAASTPEFLHWVGQGSAP